MTLTEKLRCRKERRMNLNDERNRSSEDELDDILGSLSTNNPQPKATPSQNGSLLPKRQKDSEQVVQAKPAAPEQETPAPVQTPSAPSDDASKPFSHPFINGGELQPSLEESIRESEKSGKHLVSSDKADAQKTAVNDKTQLEGVGPTLDKTPAQRAETTTDKKPSPAKNNVQEKSIANNQDKSAEKSAPAKKTAKKDKPSSEKQPIPSEKVDTGDDLVVLDESEEKTRFHDTAFVGVLKMVIYIVVVLTVSLYIAYGIILAGNDIFAFSKGERAERKVTLPEGLSVTEIAQVFEKNGIIDSTVTFEYYAKFKEFKEKKSDEEQEQGVQTVEASESTFVTLINKVMSYAFGFFDYLKDEIPFEYIPGDYLLDNTMPYDKLLDEITRVKTYREIIRITIPEGYTTDEILNLFAEKGLKATRSEFVDAINNYDYDYEFVKNLTDEGIHNSRTYRLDGYLFPDTYEFYNDESAVSVIDKLLTNFDRKFDSTYFDRAADLGMTVDEIINLAAIIEKEAKIPAEQLLISSVFHNRITSGDPSRLESCATIQYIYQTKYNERKARILDADTRIEHPYNTYLNKGLPPGPIANPGLNAIIAALYPEDTPYKFFVAKKDGSSLFATNIDEHLKNKAIADAEYEE